MKELSIPEQLTQLKIGTNITIILQGVAKELSGTVVSRNAQQVVIEKDGRHMTITATMIGFMDVPAMPTSANGHYEADGSQEGIVPTSPLQTESSTETEIFRLFVDITADFTSHFPHAKIAVLPSNFRLSVDGLPTYRQKDIANEWEFVKNDCLFMINNNTLAKQSNRIINILKTFIAKYPSLFEAKRHLAYIFFLSGNIPEALRYYKYASIASHAEHDWQNVSALALQTKNIVLACYTLQQLFEHQSFDKNDAWYLYVEQVQKSNNHAFLLDFLKTGQREFSPEEKKLLWRTFLYLLVSHGQDHAARVLAHEWQEEKKGLTDILSQDIFDLFHEPLSEAFLQVEDEFCALPPQEPAVETVYKAPPDQSTSPTIIRESASPSPFRQPITQPLSLAQHAQGSIYTYKASRGYGFLYGADGENYFFHSGSVSNIELLNHLKKLSEMRLDEAEWIPVLFEPAPGPQGPVAVRVGPLPKNMVVKEKAEQDRTLTNGVTTATTQSVKQVTTQETEEKGTTNNVTSIQAQSTQVEASRQTIDKIFTFAHKLAEDKKYPKALQQIKRVLALDPAYPGAQEAHDQWREYARQALIPKGSTPYDLAKKALYHNNLESAVDLLDIAIRQNDHKESAVKDLAALFLRLSRGPEAIQLLNQYYPHMRDQQAIENLLVQAYQKEGKYHEAINLMKKKIEKVSPRENSVHLYWLIASNYTRMDDYHNAQIWFHKVARTGTEARKIAAQISIALCLIKQQNYREAEEILGKVLILDLPENVRAQVADLLKQIQRSKQTGQSAQLDEIITGTSLSDFSSGINGFTRFFLERCNYEGVAPARAQAKTLDHSDIERLDELARQLGAKRPNDRAKYYLSAAMIASTIEELEDQNMLYRYLCRSFTSRGDALVMGNGQTDAALAWYSEALRIYNGDRSHSQEERDAVCALVRFLYANLELKQVPMKDIPLFDDALQEILATHSSQEKVLAAIAYLVACSGYAEDRILRRLHKSTELQLLSFAYLEDKGCTIPNRAITFDEFTTLWRELIKKEREETRTLLAELRLISKIEINIPVLERCLDSMRDIGGRLFFNLDQQRAGQLQMILETAMEVCRQRVFEEQERFCMRIDVLCQDLLQEIEVNPTRVSVEHLYPIIEAVRSKSKEYLEEIYRGSLPQLTLRSAFESYTPDNNKIDVQIVIVNALGCSPAESLELVIQDDEKFFELDTSTEILLRESLRGGEQRILNVPLKITERASQAQAFSLLIYVLYRTRTTENYITVTANISIPLYSSEQFEEITNPYANYAEGGVVRNAKMFYGREQLIEKVFHSIYSAREQCKSIVIFGQKRSGKSSILYHLNIRFAEKKEELLILNIGNIGGLLDQESRVPLLYLIFWGIIDKLHLAIEDEEERGRPSLAIEFPDDLTFYKHPSPLTLFREVFYRFKRKAARVQGWAEIRLVLLIDEFSYIYTKIAENKLSEDFMKNWKAIIEDNFFSLVLVGQDTMPKFKARFPNDFGVIEDIRVNYLEEEAATRLIDEPILIGGKKDSSRYREKAIARIVELTAGSPFYIQIICNRLVEYMNNKKKELVTEADVDQVKNGLIQGTRSFTWENFDNLVSSSDTAPDALPDEDVKKVLIDIANYSRSGLCNRNMIDCETKYSVDVILDDLVRRQVIERKEGQYYRIRVGLFKEWLLAQ